MKAGNGFEEYFDRESDCKEELNSGEAGSVE